MLCKQASSEAFFSTDAPSEAAFAGFSPEPPPGAEAGGGGGSGGSLGAGSGGSLGATRQDSSPDKEDGWNVEPDVLVVEKPTLGDAEATKVR